MFAYFLNSRFRYFNSRSSVLPWMLAGLAIGTGPIFADEHTLVGHWSGTVTLGTASTPVEFHFKDTGEQWTGTVSFPRSGIRARPLNQVVVSRKRVEVEFSLGLKPNGFEGKLKNDTLVGEFAFGGDTFHCELQRYTPNLPYTTEDTTFTNGDVSLAATLFLPEGSGPHPAIVMLHGSGESNERWRFRYWGDFFARQGVALLTFDKRGVGESTGDWYEVGFEPLARDGIAGVELLKTRTDIDPSRIGMTGISQAGWLMVLAASLSDDISFLIIDSGATYSVAVEGHFDYLVRVRDAGFSESEITRAHDILKRNDAVTRTGEGHVALMADVRPLLKEPWYKVMQLFIDSPTSANRLWYRNIIDFDPAPLLKDLDIPIGWLYGDEDKSVDPTQCIPILKGIQEEMDKDYTIVQFPKANHGLHVPESPAVDALPLRVYADGVLEAKTRFVEKYVTQ